MLKDEVIETLWCCISASRESRTGLTTTDYDKSTTLCSSDASAGGNGSATTTPVILRPHACQDRRESIEIIEAQMEDTLRGWFRRTYGRGAPVEAVMLGACWG